MELHPNARVLPSNAPALQEDTNGLLSTPTDFVESSSSDICQRYNRGNDCSACNLSHSCLRCKQHGHPAIDCERGILRVSSGNVRSSVFQSHNTDLKTANTQKHGFGPASSLIDPPHHSAQAAIKEEHSRRLNHSSWSLPKGPPYYWGVEFETERYRVYREKSRQKGSQGVWSDRIEEAFQIAIRKYQRPGRKKSKLGDRLLGGNEFISHYILKTTGVERTRKQVSSHLQVLKGKLKYENREWMSLVADILAEESRKKGHGSTAHEQAAGRCEDLEYDDSFDYQSSQASYPPSSNRPPGLPPVESGPTIRRVLDFAMTLVEGDQLALRHTFTSIQSETASTPKALADVNNWRELYPPLAAYHDHRQIDCPIFHFDSHLSLMDHPYGLNLAIRLSMHFSRGAHFTEWRSYPRFFERNGSPVDLAGIYQDYEPWDKLDSRRIEGTDDSELGPIAFRSEWWVRVFSNILSGKKALVDKNEDPQRIKEEEQRAVQEIRGISVMQEIWATHRENNHRSQRMAILLWKFGTAKRGETATTSWRRLMTPLSAYEIQSPHPPFGNPPMTLDTTLQAASPYFAPSALEPSLFSGYSAGDLILAPPPEDGAPSTTPTPESCSVPSSTSASFSASASNSAYSLYPSQQTSLHSQGSAYPILDSFDSQDARYAICDRYEITEASRESYRSHDFTEGSQDSYGSQDVVYQSQDSLYPHATDQLYEYPCHVVDAPVTASTCHDFTGGQIHLSYAQTEDSASSYETPLIAPQANMVPQHRLIQHPEHFDQHEYLDQSLDDLGGGHHAFDEHGSPLPQANELNGLALDYNAWEEALQVNPDLEGHLTMTVVDEVRRTEQRYIGPVGQEALESTPGEVLGEVDDGADTSDGRLAYQ